MTSGNRHSSPVDQQDAADSAPPSLPPPQLPLKIPTLDDLHRMAKEAGFKHDEAVRVVQLLRLPYDMYGMQEYDLTQPDFMQRVQPLYQGAVQPGAGDTVIMQIVAYSLRHFVQYDASTGSFFTKETDSRWSMVKDPKQLGPYIVIVAKFATKFSGLTKFDPFVRKCMSLSQVKTAVELLSYQQCLQVMRMTLQTLNPTLIPLFVDAHFHLLLLAGGQYIRCGFGQG